MLFIVRTGEASCTRLRTDQRPPADCATTVLRRLPHLALQIVRQPHLRDQVKLGLAVVDVLLRVLHDVFEKLS